MEAIEAGKALKVEFICDVAFVYSKQCAIDLTNLGRRRRMAAVSALIGKHSRTSDHL
jgi:hypothetical protein